MFIPAYVPSIEIYSWGRKWWNYPEHEIKHDLMRGLDEGISPWAQYWTLFTLAFLIISTLIDDVLIVNIKYGPYRILKKKYRFLVKVDNIHESHELLLMLIMMTYSDTLYTTVFGDEGDVAYDRRYYKKKIYRRKGRIIKKSAYDIVTQYDNVMAETICELWDEISWERLVVTYLSSVYKYKTSMWYFFWRGAMTYPFKYKFNRTKSKQRTAFYNTIFIEDRIGQYMDTSIYEAQFLAADIFWVLREYIGVPRTLQGFFQKIILFQHKVYPFWRGRRIARRGYRFRKWRHQDMFEDAGYTDTYEWFPSMFFTKRRPRWHASWIHQPYYSRHYYAKHWNCVDLHLQQDYSNAFMSFLAEFLPLDLKADQVYSFPYTLDCLPDDLNEVMHTYWIDEEHFLGYNMFEADIYFDSVVSGQIGFQDPATPIMEGIIDLHHDLFFFMVVISIFVVWILSRIIYFFAIRNNEIHIPLRFTHHTTLEVVWTIIPSLILILIAVPSFALLYAMDEIINPSITIKTVGHQWYWSYEYSDQGVLAKDQILFDSYMMLEEDLTLGYLRLLEVDNRVVLPSKVHVRLLITAADVLHSWAVPSLGIKLDACPGRLNQVAVYIKRNGTFYGQCSEICGVNHAFMPIAVDAVSMDDYIQWVSSKLEENN